MSYMALIEAQARPHSIGYRMPAKQFGSGADVLADCKAVRDRLRPPAPSARVHISRLVAATPEPVCEPVDEVAEEAMPPRRPHDFIFLNPTGPKPVGTKWTRAAAEQIIAEVAAKHLVSIAQVKGQSRLREVIGARFEVFYRMSTELGYSLPMVGKAVGGRDHSGVLHGIRKHKARMEAAGL